MFRRGGYIESNGERPSQGDQGYEYKNLGPVDNNSDHLIRTAMEGTQFMRREWAQQDNDNYTEDYREGTWWG